MCSVTDSHLTTISTNMEFCLSNISKHQAETEEVKNTGSASVLLTVRVTYMIIGGRRD